MEQLKLSEKNLLKLKNKTADIKTPAYNRQDVRVGIFHFGVGNFHRSHQALIMDSLFGNKLGLDYGICGVGVLPQDAKMRDILKEQDYLYTCIEKSSDGHFTYRIIGSIIDYMFAPDNVNSLIERLCTSEAKIITLTITEGGYNINPSTGDFDATSKMIQDDLNDPKNPKTVFGIVVEALNRRMQRKLKGFTILSCDNLQENGKMAKKAFCSYAKAANPTLADWMLENVSFPSSMVDRITPVTTDDDRQGITEKFGFFDGWPVACEDFIHWVIEDDFVDGKRPPFENHSAVNIVENVEPYEMMKLRIINAGHQAIAYFGLMLDFKYVHDVTQNESIVEFLRSYMDVEATGTLKELKGIDLGQYKSKTVERFQNPHILDTLMRLAFDGSDRIFKFVVPVIKDRLKGGKSIWLSTAIIASFAAYLSGKSELEKSIEIVDRAKIRLMSLNAKLQADPTSIRDENELFGDIVKNSEFIRVFQQIYRKIQNCGSEKTLKWLVSMDLSTAAK